MGYAPPRPLLVFTVAALSVPAAAAQAFSQVALRPSPERAVTTCLRYAGTPGSLALLGPLGRRSSPADFVEAGEAGLTAGVSFLVEGRRSKRRSRRIAPFRFFAYEEAGAPGASVPC